MRDVVAFFWCCFDAHLVFIRFSGFGVIPLDAINGAYSPRDQPTDVSRFFRREAARVIATQDSAIHRHTVRGTPKEGIRRRLPLAILWLFMNALGEAEQHLRISDLSLAFDG
ncbi:MAG: hypothetical protein WKF53_10885 [Rubrobacter sp.]